MLLYNFLIFEVFLLFGCLFYDDICLFLFYILPLIHFRLRPLLFLCHLLVVTFAHLVCLHCLKLNRLLFVLYLMDYYLAFYLWENCLDFRCCYLYFGYFWYFLKFHLNLNSIFWEDCFPFKFIFININNYFMPYFN